MNDDFWDKVRGLGRKLGKGVNELSFWLSWHASEELEYCSLKLVLLFRHDSSAVGRVAAVKGFLQVERTQWIQ